MSKKKVTTEALDILRQRYYEGRKGRLKKLDRVRATASVGRLIVALRQEAKLTQRELAKLVDTTASVICRLEDADYEGHSLAMLNRIAIALDRQVEIRFVRKNSRAA